MEEMFVITMKDIMEADIVFFSNSYLKNDLKGNFSYVVWYNKNNQKIILAKSRRKAQKTNLDFIVSYKNIEDYFKNDIEKNREHLTFYEEGLFEEIENFLKRYEKEDILKKLDKQKLEKLNELREEEEMRNSYKNKAHLGNPDERRTSLFQAVKSRILQIKETKEPVEFPEETLSEVQKKISKTMTFSSYDIDIYAKNIIKMFWEHGIPGEEQISDMLFKILNIDFNTK